jgi:uncharacterized protein (TIGR03067 family)
MRKVVLTLLAVGLMLGADDKKDANKEELKKLEGTWKIESMEQNGTKVAEEEFKDLVVTVKGDTYTVKNGDKVIDAGTFKIDATKKPKTMDTTPTDGQDKGKTILSIYELDGDTYKECQAEAGSKNRPTEFSTKSGGGHTLFVMKRQKSE